MPLWSGRPRSVPPPGGNKTRPAVGADQQIQAVDEFHHLVQRHASRIDDAGRKVPVIPLAEAHNAVPRMEPPVTASYFTTGNSVKSLTIALRGPRQMAQEGASVARPARTPDARPTPHGMGMIQKLRNLPICGSRCAMRAKDNEKGWMSSFRHFHNFGIQLAQVRA